VTSAPLHLSYDEHLDWLEATPFGTVMDRQGADRWRGVSERFGFFLDRPEGAEIGFKVVEFSQFDPDDATVSEIFGGPLFDAPTLGLRDVSAGEIVLAAVPFVDGTSTVDRLFFTDAIAAEGEQALAGSTPGRKPDGALRRRLHAAGPGAASRGLSASARVHGAGAD
jgi:hypothetical protein